MTDHPLPKPPFTDRDRAAYDWVIQHANEILWYVDYKTGTAHTLHGRNYASVVELAQYLGWEG